MNRRTTFLILFILLAVSGITALVIKENSLRNSGRPEHRVEEGSGGSGYDRIVSLAPSITKNLFYLGAGDKLVGCTSYCDLPEGSTAEVVATAIHVELEKIVGLQPDLILLTQLTNPEIIAFLRKMNARIEVLPTPRSFDEICSQFVFLSELTGNSVEAEIIIKESRDRVNEISKSGLLQENEKILFQIGTNPVFTVLPNTFMNDYITLLGGSNIANGMKGGIISRENVVAWNPDIIFMSIMGTPGKDEEAIWESYHVLNAAKSGRIFQVDPDLACQPTPVTFVETLEAMEAVLK